MLPIVQIVLTLLAGLLLGFLLFRRRDAETPRTTSGGAVRDDMYRAGFDQAPVGIAHLGTAGQWLQANRRFAIALGYSLDELLKAPQLHTMIHADERKQHVSQTKKLVAGEIAHFTALRRILMKNGRYGTFRVWMSASRRKPEFVECVLSEPDSGPQQESSAATAGLDVLEFLDDIAVIRSTPTAVISSINSAAEKMFGFKPDQLVGKARSLLYRDADVWAEKPSADLRSALNAKKFDLEDERVGKDGFVFSTRVTIIPEVESETLKGFVEVFRPVTKPVDVEEQKRSRLQLQEVTEKARIDLEKSQSEIERLTVESARFREAARRAEQVGRANEELRKENDSLKADLRKKEGIEQSLRDALQQLRMTDEELMNELKTMTETLRREIERRKTAEQFLQEAEIELARTSAEWQQRLEQLQSAAAAEKEPSEAAETFGKEAPPEQVWATFDEVSPVELLMQIELQERSGTLLIRSGDAEQKFHFTQGRIYSCASSDPALYLAQLLTKNGTISEQQRTRAIEVSRQAGIALGRILVIMDAVSEQQLIDVMHYKIDREVADLIVRHEGRSTFIEGEVPLVNMIPLRVEVGPLLETALAGPAGPSSEVSPTSVLAEPRQFAIDELGEHGEHHDPAAAPTLEQELCDESSKVVFSAPSDLADITAIDGAGAVTEAPPSTAGETTAARLPEAGTAAGAVEPVDEHVAELQLESGRVNEAALLVGSKTGKSKKYHRSTCTNARRITGPGRVIFESEGAAEAAGYKRCKTCLA